MAVAATADSSQLRARQGPLRVFISSPGDVAEERVVVGQVLRRLRSEFEGPGVVEPVDWEHEPLLATASFQEQIPSPHREALAMERKLLGNEHPDVALSLNDLGDVLYHEGNYTGAEALHREALAMQRKLLGNQHPDVAETLTGLGSLLVERGDARPAEALLREALQIREKALPKGHPKIA